MEKLFPYRETELWTGVSVLQGVPYSPHDGSPSPSYHSLKSSKDSSSWPECHHATHQFFMLSTTESDLKLFGFVWKMRFSLFSDHNSRRITYTCASWQILYRMGISTWIITIAFVVACQMWWVPKIWIDVFANLMIYCWSFITLEREGMKKVFQFKMNLLWIFEQEKLFTSSLSVLMNPSLCFDDRHQLASWASLFVAF